MEEAEDGDISQGANGGAYGIDNDVGNFGTTTWNDDLMKFVDGGINGAGADGGPEIEFGRIKVWREAFEVARERIAETAKKKEVC